MANALQDILDDVVDLRDVIERFEELESEHDDLEAECADSEEDGTKALNDWIEENNEEFQAITDLLDNLKGYGGDEQWRGDWYPVTLISEDYFTDYCKDLVQDIGDLPNGIPSYIEIDWDATAKNLRVDYSEVEINGNTYLYR